jgi:hypothetical protein
MERLDAAADPRSAIVRDLYVPPAARSIADEVVGRLALQPASTQLIVGGIGSGKTTQLLVAEQRLREVRDTEAVYLDISREHDLQKLRAGVLVALAGLAFVKLLVDDKSAAVDGARSFFREWAIEGSGYFPDGPPGYDEPDPDWVHVPPVISPPPTPSLTSGEGAALKTLTDALRSRVPHVALLVDSLDRVRELEHFEQLVRHDVAILRALGIGVVLVGPLKLLYGAWRPIAAPFDKLYQVAWVDPAAPGGRDFLTRVLRVRSSENLGFGILQDAGVLSDEGAARLVDMSGGVLRDLIGLARDAGEEAYLAGDDAIGPAHADAAADAFGRTLMLGLAADDLAILQRVRTQGSFVPVSDRDLALLMTGRVLEFRNGPVRYAVHPTIRPLLAQLAATP